MNSQELLEYLAECREATIGEIRRIIPRDGIIGKALYDLILDYPLREAKGLRPALCIASCRALGGKLESVLRTAAVLELYHNAFLIHDDIEDDSLVRRGRPTLHRDHGTPIAVNVGDAMLALSLQPLLDNVAVLGLGPALRILEAVARMTRESVEGQALELDWIRRGTWSLEDVDYVRMVEQKTGWYSFITPVTVGAVAAGADQGLIDQLAAYARALSVAFQIQDDLLNLRGEAGAYGKEIGGDLWEGKRTVILLHAMRLATPAERKEAERILALPRPRSDPAEAQTAADRVMDELVRRGDLSAEGRASIRAARDGQAKTENDVRFLFALIDQYGSLAAATEVALRFATEARTLLDACRPRLLASPHSEMLEAIVLYVLARVR